MSNAAASGDPVSLLLVEDDPLDVTAMKRALRKQRIANPMFVARDGLEAIEALRGQRELPCFLAAEDSLTESPDPAKVSSPYLILLDLNMPRMSGLEFLEELRGDNAIRNSIVFVLTTSDSDRDVISAYDNCVAGYLLKDRVGDDFIDLLSLLDHYWRLVEFPRPSDP